MTTMDKVREILAYQLGINEEQVHPESTSDDLGMDSLDNIEIVMAMEEEFDVCISDEEAEKVKTVQDMVELIDRLRDEQKAKSN